MMEYFVKYSDQDIRSLTRKRPYEVKLGERVSTGFGKGKYVMLGIPESLGVKANEGVGGTESLWNGFLSSFLNIQSTAKFSGEGVAVLGHFDFSHIDPGPGVSLNQYREAVETIDQAVMQVVRDIVVRGKVPVIIGGGHNNCFPIIEGVAHGLSDGSAPTSFLPIHVVNMDAHADFRNKEGRHSGNGFRYAYEAGFLEKYAVLGLSENYNSQSMLDEILSQEGIDLIFWEDIFLREKLTFPEALERLREFVKGRQLGIELDMDALKGSLSSALSPCGFSTTQARKYVHFMAENSEPAYLYICEGAMVLDNGLRDPGAGKLVSFLVSDFMKAVK